MFRQQMADFVRGEQLVRLREGKRLSQETAAAEIGVSAKSLRTWEKGGAIRWHNAEKLAQFYGVDPASLVEHESVRDNPDPVDTINGNERRDPVQRELAVINAKLDILLQRDGLALADLTEEITRYFEETLGKRSEADSADRSAGRRSDARAASVRSRSQGTRRTA